MGDVYTHGAEVLKFLDRINFHDHLTVEEIVDLDRKGGIRFVMEGETRGVAIIFANRPPRYYLAKGEREWRLVEYHEYKAATAPRCPDCGRTKAETLGDCLAGKCGKWYAIRDPDAEKDCFSIRDAPKKWIVEDWAGNRMFHDREFATFEDGWAFLREKFPDEKDHDDLFVVQPGGE